MRARYFSSRRSIGALAISSVALLTMAIACGDGVLTTGSSELTPPAADGGSFQLGVTSPVNFATTVAPSPTPAPPTEPAPSPDDGKVRIRGILLAFDTTCPGCTLVTRRGTVFVPDDAELFESTDEGEFPITFDDLNAALRPGLPLRITVDETGAGLVADDVRVEHFFTTTGDIDGSSKDVLSRREFVLGVFNDELGRTEIPYVLAADAVVESFKAFERVYVFGVVKDGVLKAKLVRRDE